MVANISVLQNPHGCAYNTGSYTFYTWGCTPILSISEEDYRLDWSKCSNNKSDKEWNQYIQEWPFILFKTLKLCN